MGRLASLGGGAVTFEDFTRQMDRLEGLKFRPKTLQTHWEALQDVPAGVLDLAITRCQRTCEHFPTPVELRRAADLSRTHQAPDEDRSVELAEPVTIGKLPTGAEIMQTRVWKYYHEDCSDSGMESLWCGEPGTRRKPWQPMQSCGRTAPHDAHEWVRRCTCYDSNPALVRKRERQQQFAESKGRAA